MGSIPTELPYWQINVPPHERTAECPEFLRSLSDKDRNIISTPDSEFQVDNWSQVAKKARTQKLEEFKRVPSHLRRYLEWKWKLKQDSRYQVRGVMDYVLKERLHWELSCDGEGKPFVASKGRPFECPKDDIKILCNDWPYGIDSEIVHLVVWTKFKLEEDPKTGRLTVESDAKMRSFAYEKFAHYNVSQSFSILHLHQLAAPPLMLITNEWIKYVCFHNWGELKSVPLVEHFHVMLHKPTKNFVLRVTNGDIPRSQARR